jgi:hypothetical protein
VSATDRVLRNGTYPGRQAHVRSELAVLTDHLGDHLAVCVSRIGKIAVRGDEDEIANVVSDGAKATDVYSSSPRPSA